MAWVYELRRGGKALSLSAGAPGSPGIGVQDAEVNLHSGQPTGTLPLILYTAKGRELQTIRRLCSQIEDFLRWAAAYGMDQYGDPVELWAWPDDGVGMLPTYGDPLRMRRVTGGELVPPYGRSVTQFEGDKVVGYTLNLTFDDTWFGPTTWAMCAKGGIFEQDGGLAVWEGTTNLCRVPYGVSGWAAVNGATLANVGELEMYTYGQYKYSDTAGLITVAVGQTYGGMSRIDVTTPPLGASYTLSAYGKGLGGSIGATLRVRIEESGGTNPAQESYTDVTLTDDWPDQPATVTHTVQRADRTTLTIEVTVRNVMGNDAVLVNAVQLEQKAYRTPFAAGDLGQGHRWTGAANNSNSERAAAALWGSANEGVVCPAHGTVSLWVTGIDWDDGRVHYFFDIGENAAYNRLRLYKTAGNTLVWSMIDRAGTEYTVSTDCSAFLDASEYHLVGIWSRNDLRLRVNGASVGTPVTSCKVPGKLGNTFYVGCDRSRANPCNATILSDLRLYDRALSEQAATCLYAAGRSAGVLPYMASRVEGYLSEPPTIRIDTHQDNDPHQNWARIGNVPGDAKARTRLLAKCPDGPLLVAYYYGLRRREDTYDGLHLNGTQFGYSAYGDNVYLGASSIAVADATCAYGYKVRTTPPDASWQDAFCVGVWNMPGRWTVYARICDNSAASGLYHVRIKAYNVVGTLNPWTPSSSGVTTPIVNVWTLLELGEIELPPLAGNKKRYCQWALDFQVQRDSGNGTFDTDFLLLVPCECSGRINRLHPTTYIVGMDLDGIADPPYAVNRLGTTIYYGSYQPPTPLEAATGDFITLEPHETGRLFITAINGAPNGYEYLTSDVYAPSIAMQIQPRYNSPW